MRYKNLKHVMIYGIEPYGELETDKVLPLAKGAIELVKEEEKIIKKHKTKRIHQSDELKESE